VEINIYVFLNSTHIADEFSGSPSGRFTPWESDPDIHWTGGWPGRGSVYKKKNRSLRQESNPSRLASSQLVYLLAELSISPGER
jgi:hypothetical protein